MKIRFPILLFLSIAAVGVGLRMWRFQAMEPYNSDEAAYLRQGRFMYGIARKVFGMNSPVIDADKDGIWRYVRKTDWYDKPCWLHSAFISGFMVFTGANTAAGNLTNFCFSVAAVILVYVIGRRMCGDAGGLFAAGLLAVSFYWMIYSRGHWAGVDGVFFVLLSFYFLIKTLHRVGARRGYILLAGAMAAVGVLCHYMLLYACLPLGITAFVVSDRTNRVRSVFLFVVAYGTLLAVVAVFLRVSVAVLSPRIPFTGLIGAILQEYLPGRTKLPAETGFQPLNGLAFVYYLLRNNGCCAAVLCVMGLLSVFWRTERGAARGPLFGGLTQTGESTATGKMLLGAISCILVPLAVLSFQRWVVARALLPAIPFICLVAGKGLDEILKIAAERHGVGKRVLYAITVLLICGAFTENVMRDIRFAGNKIGYREVAGFLTRRRGGRIFANPEAACIYGWYAPDLPYESMHRLHGLLGSENLEGAYVVFDAQKFHMYPGSVANIGRLEERIKSRGDIVLEVPNMTTGWTEFLMDGTQAHTLSEMLASIRNADVSDITTIRVYRLSAGETR